MTTLASADAPAAEENNFDIWEFQVQGNTLLPTVDIERVVYAFLGEHKSIEDVAAAQHALEDLYHARGYASVLVDIPEQDVNGGVVSLKVLESKIARTRVTGSRYFSLGRIKSKVPSLAPGTVPDIPQVQKDLTALAQLSPDRVITPVLRPSRTPGKLDVELKVKDELPLHGNLELNDRFSADTTRLRLTAGLHYDNLWQREHSIGATYIVSPEDSNEVQVFVGNYTWKFDNSDRVLAVYGVKSDTDVATIGTLGVLGAGMIVGARYTVPLRSFGNYYHSVVLGADYKDFDEVVGLRFGDGGLDTAQTITPVSYLMFGLAYNGTWLREKANSHFNVFFNFGPRGLGNTQKEFERKRFRAKPDFAYAKISVDTLESLPGGFDIFGQFELQAADSPLVNNEQYSAGGVESVRGYIESESLGDDALALTVELHSPDLNLAHWDRLNNLELIAFSDAALLNVQSPLPGSDASQFLWSAGFGLRLAALDQLQANVFWAYPLTDGDRTLNGDERVHFSVDYEF